LILDPPIIALPGLVTHNIGQCPHNSQVANLPLATKSLEVREGILLDNERAVWIDARPCSLVLDPPLPIAAEIIVSQAIVFWIDETLQPILALGPLAGIDFELKHGILHPLSEIQTRLGNMPQSLAAGWRDGAHIIGHKHIHRTTPASTPKKGWVDV
jgi:hypothetical protein